MNYIKQVNAFFESLLTNSLSANAQCLYSNLLNINNRCNWQKEFVVANSTLSGFTCLNKQALYRARNELIQKKYIKFKKGVNQNLAGKYEIIEFVTADNTTDNTANDTPNNIANNTINKLNKTKQKNIKKNNKKKFGEYENVLLDDAQYEKLTKDFPNDYKTRIQNLDDYIQMHGNKYKDHLATIQTWARKEGYKKPKETKKNEDEYKEINVEEMSETEYLKLVRGG